MAEVNEIANGLSHEMIADGRTLQVVSVEDIPTRLHIAWFSDCPAHIEVVAALTRQFKTIKAPLTGFFGKHL